MAVAAQKLKPISKEATDMVQIAVDDNAEEAVQVPLGFRILHVGDIDALAATNLTPYVSVDGGTSFNPIDIDLEGRSYPEAVGAAAVPLLPKTFMLPPSGLASSARVPVQFKFVTDDTQTSKNASVSASR